MGGRFSYEDFMVVPPEYVKVILFVLPLYAVYHLSRQLGKVCARLDECDRGLNTMKRLEEEMTSVKEDLNKQNAEVETLKQLLQDHVESRENELEAVKEEMKDLKMKTAEIQPKAVPSDKTGKTGLNIESGALKAVVKLNNLLTPTGGVEHDKERNTFEWKTCVEEWRMSESTYSPTFCCHSNGGVPYRLCIHLYSNKQMFLYFEREHTEQKNTVIFNAEVEFVTDEVTKEGKKAGTKKFVDLGGRYTLCNMNENVYKPLILNNVLTISCSWT